MEISELISPVPRQQYSRLASVREDQDGENILKIDSFGDFSDNLESNASLSINEDDRAANSFDTSIQQINQMLPKDEPPIT
jgi:hypothetical protein